MSESLGMHIIGLEELRARLRSLPADLRLEQRIGVSKAAGIVKDEVQARIHSPGGHARRGIKIAVSGTGLGMRAVVKSGNRQAVFSQRSRGAGTTPPPMKAARAIARQYGLPMAAARAIAIVIGRRGTAGHPVMAEAFEAKKPAAVQIFVEALLNVARTAAGR